jgi:hypothetical protein
VGRRFHAAAAFPGGVLAEQKLGGGPEGPPHKIAANGPPY